MSCMAANLPTMGNVVKGHCCPPSQLFGVPDLGNLSGMANRIRELREKAGLSRNALAGLAGTTANQLVKLEGGSRRLSDHWAHRLAPHLDVQAFELMMPAGARIEVRWVPLVGEISCGAWGEAVERSGDMVPTTHGGARSFALKPNGDSMDKLVGPDGFVVVDPDQAELLADRVFAVINDDGETTVKRYRATPPRLEPCSNNPAHMPIMIGQQGFRVIGRVVEVTTPV